MLVPYTVGHEVPDAGSVVVAVLLVVGVVVVGRTEVVSELVTKHSDSRHLCAILRVAYENFGLYGVFLHADVAIHLVEKLAAVRLYIRRVTAHFLSHSLVDDGKSVEFAVTVVVELRDVKFRIDKCESVAYEVGHVLCAVE